MTTPLPTYARPTIAAVQPPLETWTDVRCPACVKLGWLSSRVLFRVVGKIEPSGATIRVVCPRCNSTIAWLCGLPELRIEEQGRKNEKRRKVAFE